MKKIIRNTIFIMMFSFSNVYALGFYAGAGVDLFGNSSSNIKVSGFGGINVSPNIGVEIFTRDFRQFTLYGVFHITLAKIITPFVKLGLGTYKEGSYDRNTSLSLVGGLEVAIDRHSSIGVGFYYDKFNFSNDNKICYDNYNDILISYKFTF